MFTFQRRKRHTAEQIVARHREADAPPHGRETFAVEPQHAASFRASRRSVFLIQWLVRTNQHDLPGLPLTQSFEQPVVELTNRLRESPCTRSYGYSDHVCDECCEPDEASEACWLFLVACGDAAAAFDSSKESFERLRCL